MPVHHLESLQTPVLESSAFHYHYSPVDSVSEDVVSAEDAAVMVEESVVTAAS